MSEASQFHDGGRTPMISVILPVRNGSVYIDEALRSVFAQTEQDFEIIAVDDGSSDDTPDRLRRWAARDPRLMIISQSGVGPARAINTAIGRARGEYLARMDADDICVPTRFEEQIVFLARSPRVGVCGSWVKTFGVAGRHTWRTPTADPAIRARLVFDSPLAHPSVMMRRSFMNALNPIYRNEFGRAEDYDLWDRLSGITELANLPKVLLYYRMHENQVTVTAKAASAEGAALVRSRILYARWPNMTDSDILLHQQICTNALPVTIESLVRAEAWLLRMLELHRRNPFVPGDVWLDTLALKWWEVCHHFRSTGLQVLVRFVKSPLLRPGAIPVRRWLRLLVETTCQARRK